MLFLRCHELPVHAVKGSPSPQKCPDDQEQGPRAQPSVQPLTGEDEQDNRNRELKSDSGEIRRRWRTPFIPHAPEI